MVTSLFSTYILNKTIAKIKYKWYTPLSEALLLMFFSWLPVIISIVILIKYYGVEFIKKRIYTLSKIQKLKHNLSIIMKKLQHKFD
jgi:hypothetical protein